MPVVEEGKSVDREAGADWLLYRRTLIFLTVTVMAVVALSGIYLLRLESELVESIALNNAELSSSALREFRTLYTSEVVEPARNAGMTVTHDYRGHYGAIPLPVTLSIMLGNRMDTAAGSSVRLYSDYPFPWRSESGGPKDSFQRLALVKLRSQPKKPVSVVEEREGRRFLRYATSDLMRESCVDCHNSHGESPKTDWRVGDVRGVLELTLPLEPKKTETRATLRGFLGVLIAVVFLGLITLALFAFRLRSKSLVAAALAAETTKVNETLEQQIREKERVEAERGVLEEQVRHAQKLESLGLLAGGIAHDFNNLLMGVLGNATLAEAGLPKESGAQREIEAIRRAAYRARDLTGQLLAYAGKGQFESVPIDLSSFVEEGKQLLGTSRAQSSELVYELEEGLPAIEADPSQMQQVLLNLVTNAMESLGQNGGRVTVRTGRMEATRAFLDSCLFSADLYAGEYVYLEVSDDGTGIEEDTLTKIFDPFFSTKSDGSGLGLAALQGIVRGHQGALTVDSQPGVGTCFRVLFTPSDKPAQPSAAAPSGVSPVPTGQTVLIVDDTDDVREITASLLSNSGYVVLSSATGETGLELFEDHRDEIDFVLLDMRMPGMGGAETWVQLRRLEPELPIILASGYGMEEEVVELVKDRFTAFLQKPYGLAALLRTVEGLLSVARTP